MEALDRIMEKVRNHSMTLTSHIQDQDTKEKLISNTCKCGGTGWVFDEEKQAYKRCKCYEKERIQRLWNKYGIDPKEIKKLNDYKPIDDMQKIAKEKAIRYITNFQEIKNMAENNFGLFGQPGAGKTHIINAIGAALISKGIEVIYMPYVETMRELKATVMDNEYYMKLSNRYMRAKVLIIDDLFKDKLKNGQLIGEIREPDIKHLYPILNYRYLNCLPILISTECTPDTLEILDEAQGGRIIERCGENITIFKGKQYNYRMRKFIK